MPPSKWIGATAVVVGIALALLFHQSVLHFAVLGPRYVLALIPLFLYGVVGLLTRKFLWSAPRPAVQIDLDKQQAASLTLAGFGFTSLNLIISFFKTDIAAGTANVQDILFYLSVALACFMASYMALRYRTKNLFSFMSDGLIDCGFWSIMVGLLVFFYRIPALAKLSIVFFFLLVFYLGYIALHFYYHVQYATKKAAQ